MNDIPFRPADFLFPNRRKSIASGSCSHCGGEAKTFKNDVSRKEYAISGFCQTCQDEVFTDSED